ncbi:hypothetical protein GCM10023169_29340 [Georgenia halophila]|uniref:LPXTG cell wall anchor domain-containing protein n=1 Tax=Georgenia halophila TaxID=620889 RepID=A0ABP8LG90_9MICO
MRRTVVVGAIGALLAIGGVVAIVTTPASFGWTAYTPLTDQESSPGIVLMDRTDVAATSVAVIGLMLLAGAGGYALGRRRNRPGASPSHGADR